MVVMAAAVVLDVLACASAVERGKRVSYKISERQLDKDKES